MQSRKKQTIPYHKGDRVVLKIPYSNELGIGSEGIVLRNVTSKYDSIPIDFVRVHDIDGNIRKSPWNGGHDCEGLAPMRNGKYYGHWIDSDHVDKISDIINDDILLLM